MTGDRRRLLDLLAEGRITPDEAERLLDALDVASAARGAPSGPAPRRPITGIRIELNADEPETSPSRADLRIPLALVRAGVRFGALIPQETRERVNLALRREGAPFDIADLSPESLEALVAALAERPIDIRHPGGRVRISCE